MKNRVSFIGAGHMAEEHIKAFSDIPGVELSGIYSRTFERAQQLASKYDFSNRCYESIEELYQKSQATLVIIAVPELSAMEVCLESFKYPWTCLVEKPIGYNYDQAILINQEAKKRDRQVYAAFNRRSYSSTRAVLEELISSSQPRLIHVFDQENPIEALSSGQPKLVVENWMYANSIHMIDYFSFLGRGEIISVEPIIKWDAENPKFVLTKITYNSGDIGIYEAVWNAPGPWAVTVTTQGKRWELRPLEQATVQLYKSRKLKNIEIDDFDKQFKPGLRFQAEEAIKGAMGLKSELVTISEGLKTMKLINQIYK